MTGLTSDSRPIVSETLAVHATTVQLYFVYKVGTVQTWQFRYRVRYRVWAFFSSAFLLTGSCTRVFDWYTETNDLGRPWTAIMHSVEHIFRSQPGKVEFILHARGRSELMDASAHYRTSGYCIKVTAVSRGFLAIVRLSCCWHKEASPRPYFVRWSATTTTVSSSVVLSADQWALLSQLAVCRRLHFNDSSSMLW